MSRHKKYSLDAEGVDRLLWQIYEDGSKIVGKRLDTETGIKQKLAQGVIAVRKAISAIIAIDVPDHPALKEGNDFEFLESIGQSKLGKRFLTPEIKTLMEYFLRSVDNVAHLEKAMTELGKLEDVIEGKRGHKKNSPPRKEMASLGNREGIKDVILEFFKKNPDGRFTNDKTTREGHNLGSRFLWLKVLRRLVEDGILVKYGDLQSTYYCLKK